MYATRVEDGLLHNYSRSFSDLAFPLPHSFSHRPYSRVLHLWCFPWGAHQFTPSSWSLFCMCALHTYAGVSITWCHLWHPECPGLCQKPSGTS